MIAKPCHVFADTAFWIALAVKNDQYHEHAERWAAALFGTITTTAAVILESASALARPAWRQHAVALLDHVQQRPNVQVIPFSADLWNRGWDLYKKRTDKPWSLTDCISFLVMQERKLTEALAADDDFRQAGFRPLLLDEP